MRTIKLFNPEKGILLMQHFMRSIKLFNPEKHMLLIRRFMRAIKLFNPERRPIIYDARATLIQPRTRNRCRTMTLEVMHKTRMPLISCANMT